MARTPDLTGKVVIVYGFAIFSGPYSDILKGQCSGQCVAVKVVRNIFRDQEAAERKLVRERDAWDGLNHPNILPLLGYTQASKDFGAFGALISPWCQKGDAEMFLAENGPLLSSEFRRDLWLGTVAGVHYLHTNDPMMVHGDLKPNNILIADNGTPKICDFGLVRIIVEEGNSGYTTASPHTGTPRYLAPELLEDEARPTAASDVYALGSIGLRFFFDEQPHKSSSQVIRDIGNGVPPAFRPSNLKTKGNRIWDLFELCWRPEPKERVDASWLCKNILGAYGDPCSLATPGAQETSDIQPKIPAINNPNPPISDLSPRQARNSTPDATVLVHSHPQSSASSTGNRVDQSLAVLQLTPPSIAESRKKWMPANKQPSVTESVQASRPTSMSSIRPSWVLPWKRLIKFIVPARRAQTAAPSSVRAQRSLPIPQPQSCRQLLQERLQKYQWTATFHIETERPKYHLRWRGTYRIGEVVLGVSGWQTSKENAKEEAARSSIGWMNHYGYH